MEQKEINGGTEENMAAEAEDGNIYRLLMDVIARHEDNLDTQQASLKEIARVMYEPSVPRRIFKVLFPSVELSRRIR